MSAFYDRMRDVASKLLAEFGIGVTVQVMTNGAYDPATMAKTKTYSPTSGNGVFLNTTKKDTQDGLILTTDTKLLIQHLSIVPTVDSTVTRGSDVLRVVAVMPLNPADTVLIYNLFLRK